MSAWVSVCWPGQPSFQRVRCCIFAGVDSPFNSRALRIQQPGKLLPDRANYEIFDDQRRLVAIAAETEAHTRRQVLSKSMPDARVLAITTSGNEPVLTLIKHARERITEVQDSRGEPAGWTRARQTNRYYTLIDGQDQILGEVVGDLALRHFSITGSAGTEFARIRKTWAGVKDMLTPADHYYV